MEIVEIGMTNPEWFWTIATPITVLLIVLIIAGSVWDSKKNGRDSITGLGVFFITALIVIWPLVGSLTSTHVPVEDKVRVAQEVSVVVGFEVSEGDVDLMLEEKPVRDVYYILDGDTLVVEE